MNGYKILKCFRKEKRISGELPCPATGLIFIVCTIVRTQIKLIVLIAVINIFQSRIVLIYDHVSIVIMAELACCSLAYFLHIKFCISKLSE